MNVFFRLLVADSYGDEVIQICGGDGGVADEQTCSIIGPKALISYKGAIYASSSDSSWSGILKIQGARFGAHNRACRCKSL